MTCRWPPHDADGRALIAFADLISSSLEEQGYCTIDLLDAPEAPEQAAARLSAYVERSFHALPPAFAAAYLGTDHSSEVASFDADVIDDPFLSGCVGQLEAATQLLEPWMLQELGFEPELPASKMLFRRSTKRPEAAAGNLASLGTLAVADTQAIVVSDPKELSQTGAIEDFLQWVPRRRFCLFLFVDISGSITLKPKKATEGSQEIQLEPLPNTMLILEHDRFTYTYTPRPNDLVLQAWVLQKRSELLLQHVAGAGASRDDVLGMVPKVMPDVPCPLQVTGGAVRGGAYTDMEQLWLALSNCLDMVKDTPTTRWDWEEVLSGIVLTDDWGIAKHCAFCDDADLTNFDAELFKASHDEVRSWHPQKRMYAEVGYSCLVNAGWTRDSLRGAHINTWSADCGYDGEFYMNAKDLWKMEAYQGADKAMTASRLSIAFGLVGSIQSVDTACSSSNVAMNLCHQSISNAVDTGEGNRAGLIFAGLVHTNAGGFLGLSMAHMLTSKGRSRTFDHSASGFVRSEGANSCFVRTMDDEGSKSIADQHVYGTIVSTAANQDGRSASLTAPNGPSQTAVIKSCMRQGKLGVDSVIKFECHGTGTALGDPIEVSSCRVVMKGRLLPLVQCSSKSNHGHLEAAAGLQGFLKTLMEISFCAAMSNCHLRVLNHNMDVSGYPILHPIEITPLDGDGPETISGVSSFGFGGTNSHANFVGLPHHRNPVKVQGGAALQLEKLDYVTTQCPRCLGRMCWLCGIAVPKSAPQGKHRCASVREDASSYKVCSNCYDGKYVLQAPRYAEIRDPGLPVYVRGSWSNFGRLEEMLWVPSLASGHYEFSITLGASRQERFQMVVDRELRSLVYPVEGDAGQHVHIDGPDADGDGKFWLIDGFLDDAPAGAKYNVRFTWGRHKRRVEWKHVVA